MFINSPDNTMASSSQTTLQIDEIRDGALVLKDHSLRAILMASSINLALKSAEEQTAIIMQFQSFLNSLEFPIQIFIQSRRLNIEPYLDTLKEQEKKEVNDLLKVQIAEYIEFVRTFVQASDIMTKTFYIVVPYTLPVAGGEGALGGITKMFGLGKKKESAGMAPEIFEEYKKQLWQRVDHVIQSIVRTGVRAVPLNTEEIIELFYGLYNPGEPGETRPQIEAQTIN